MKSLLRKIAARVVPPARPEHRLLFTSLGVTGAWPGMGRALYRSRPVFRDSIEAVGAVAREMLGFDAAARFRGEDEPEAGSAARRRSELLRLAMLQVGMIDLWREAGVEPTGILGISLGEIVAPYGAGALSLGDTARIIAAMADGVTRSPAPHRLLFVAASGAEARHVAAHAPAQLSFLGSQTPSSSLMICRADDAETLRAYLSGALVREGGARVREVATEWNFHSPHLDLDRELLSERLEGIRACPPRCPIYSSAAGGRLKPDAPFDAHFFAWMISRPFLYAEAVSAAMRDGFDTALVVGAQSILSGHLEDTARAIGASPRVMHSLRRDEGESFAEAEAALRPLAIAPPDWRHAAPADLHAFHAALRRTGPAHWIPEQGYWLVVGYEEVKHAFADASLFSSEFEGSRAHDPVLLGADPPRHREVRRRVARQFSADATASQAAFAEALADRLVEPLRQGRDFDVVSELAQPLAQAVAAELVGLDPADARAFAQPTAAAAGNVINLYSRLEEVVARVAGRSRVYAELLDDGFDEAEARSLVRLLWIAATTPQEAIPPAVLLLLEDEALRQRLVAEPTLLDAFADEALRLHPPAQIITRRLTREAEVGGRAIPAGATVQLGIAAANRDPARFADPDAVRLDRSPNPHLAFGGGRHRCIGAQLGKAMLVAGLRALLQAAPDFRAVQPLETVRYVEDATLLEIESLVIGQ